MSNIGIIGYGFVGQAVEYGFKGEGNNIKWYDKYKPSDSLNSVVDFAEFIFICLPTPISESTGRIDLSIINENIEEIAKYSKGTDKVIILKSTIVPGTTRNYAKKYPGCRFCFNPEFLTEANYLEDFVNADRHVIGADDDHTRRKVINLHKDKFPKTQIIATDLSTAEMIKYMANADLTTQVMVSNFFYELSQKLGVAYNVVRDAVELDPRIGTHHKVPGPDGDFGFGGKCFPKDLLAIMGCAEDNNIDVSVLKAVWEANLEVRKLKNWEDIPWAKSD